MAKRFFSSNMFLLTVSGHKNLDNNMIGAHEIGYNVLHNKNNLLNPPQNEERKNIFFINTDNKLMQKLNTKNLLDERDIIVIPNSANGNCFYKTISQFYYNKEIYHIYFRKTIAEYIESKKQEECIKYPYIYKNEAEVLTWHDYFNELILTGCYAGEYEIINASKIYNCNFIIYKNENYNNNDITYNFIFETIINQNEHYLNPFKPIILLGWVNNNHYVLLLPKTTILELTPLEYRNNLNDNSKEEKDNSSSKESNEEISKINTDKIKLNTQFKEYLNNYVKNEFSNFPVMHWVNNFIFFYFNIKYKPLCIRIAEYSIKNILFLTYIYSSRYFELLGFNSGCSFIILVVLKNMK